MTTKAVGGLVLLLGAAVFLNLCRPQCDRSRGAAVEGRVGLTATQFGVAVSAFFWVYGPIQLIVGWLCNRFSVYRLLAWGVASGRWRR